MQRMSLAALLAIVAVPAALAASSPPTTSTPLAGSSCTKAGVFLVGTLTSDPEFVGAGTFRMKTTSANKNGQNLVGGADETIRVGTSTRIRREGPDLIAAFETGDKVYVNVRVCRDELPLAAPTLRATPALSIADRAISGP
jgi:hypothetical protein